jgi:hypothetical protein
MSDRDENDDSYEQPQMQSPDDDIAGGDDSAGGFNAFRVRQAKGVLYKINPMPDALIKRMQEYVHTGPMTKVCI